ncbi:hypothetical protein SAMN02990966_07929 [Rhodospirillales bacterium URHD0017]|nr:hypothetical protein SAMN02990966_07929 [Rhodospirillales bacterium URHD0017]
MHDRLDIAGLPDVLRQSPNAPFISISHNQRCRCADAAQARAVWPLRVSPRQATHRPGRCAGVLHGARPSCSRTFERVRVSLVPLRTRPSGSAAWLHRVLREPWPRTNPSMLQPSRASPCAPAMLATSLPLVSKLYDATREQLGTAWHALVKTDERRATVARAVERGWIIVREDSVGRVKVRSGMLTDEGRRVARRGIRG